jgi:serine protease AprX
MRLIPRLFIALFLVTPVTALAEQKAPGLKLDDSLRESVAGGCTGTTSVIIRTKPGYREALRNSLIAAGRKVKGEFPALDAVAAEVSCADLLALVDFQSTDSISSNPPVYGHQLVDTTTSTITSGSTTIEAYGASLGKSTTLKGVQLTTRVKEALSAADLQMNLFSTVAVGQSLGSFSLNSGSSHAVGVAIIDSGIEPGVDFGDRITAFYDFTYGDIRATAPSDGYGHGTHVTGLVASAYVGMAPTARLVGLKVLGTQGQGSTDNTIRAIEFAIASKDILDIQVLNLSLGHPILEPAATDPLVQAVEHAVRAGFTVVVSAGNFGVNKITGKAGYAGIASPGNAPSAISVGSVRTFDSVSRHYHRIAEYSSRGPSWYDGFAKPDLSAPGDDLLSIAAVGSTLRLAQELRGNVGNYMRLSGTSMAAAVVSGVVALVLQTNSGLTPNAVKAVLEYTSVPVQDDAGQNFDRLSQGSGSIVGLGAVALAHAIDTSAPLGANWLRTAVTPSTTIGGETYAWAQLMIWGNHVARGSGVIDEQRPAWALGVVWGEGLTDDDNIVWGNNDDNIVWGNSFDDDDNIVWGNDIVWADNDDNIVWGNNDDNIVWGNNDDNVVWGNSIVWGSGLIGMNEDDNIVWGNLEDDNIVWGNLDDDNIVWGNLDDDNIVWGNSALFGSVIRKSDTAPGHSKPSPRQAETAREKGVR